MGACPTTLRTYIRTGNLKGVERLLEEAGEKSADLINNDFAQDCILQSCTPSVGNAFYYAIWRCKPEIAEVMLRHGADPHSTGFCEESAIHLAARCNQLRIVRHLLDNGADIWATDDHGQTVIHSAARSPYNTLEVVTFLHDMMKDKPNVIDCPDFSGKTPLHMAAWAGIPINVRTLLQLGADPNARNKAGSTPLDLAMQRRKCDVKQIQDILMENGIRENPAVTQYGAVDVTI